MPHRPCPYPTVVVWWLELVPGDVKRRISRSIFVGSDVFKENQVFQTVSKPSTGGHSSQVLGVWKQRNFWQQTRSPTPTWRTLLQPMMEQPSFLRWTCIATHRPRVWKWETQFNFGLSSVRRDLRRHGNGFYADSNFLFPRKKKLGVARHLLCCILGQGQECLHGLLRRRSFCVDDTWVGKIWKMEDF